MLKQADEKTRFNLHISLLIGCQFILIQKNNDVNYVYNETIINA